jgi:hypothetical protein
VWRWQIRVARSIYRYLRDLDSGFIPYVGVGAGTVATTGTSSGKGEIYFEGGIDYNASDNFLINANYKTSSDTWIDIGAGYRF